MGVQLTSPTVSAQPRWRSVLWLGLMQARRVVSSPGNALIRATGGGMSALTVRIGRQRLVLLVEPDDVRRLLVEHAGFTHKGPAVEGTRPLLGAGLLTSEGEEHTRQRRLVGAAFSPSQLEAYAQVVEHETDSTIDELGAGGVIDIHSEMGAVALAIVGKALLGTDLTLSAARIRLALSDSLSDFRAQRRRRSTRVPVRTRRSIAEVQEVVSELIRERRENPTDHKDVLNILVHAHDAESSIPELSDIEIRDELITLIMAGHETTANALAFAVYLLARHPAVSDRIRAEVATAGAGPFGRDVRDKLPLTRAVMQEAIRLYPPAWIFGRSIDVDLPFSHFTAPEGSVIGVSPWVLHHSERWFPNPNDFRPERWLDPEEASPRYAYLPFGAGRRGCIGEQFAWLESTIVLAKIVNSFDLDPVANTPRLDFGVTLRPRGGLPVRLTRRRSAGVPNGRERGPVEL